MHLRGEKSKLEIRKSFITAISILLTCSPGLAINVHPSRQVSSTIIVPEDYHALTSLSIERKVGVKVGDWVEYGNFNVIWDSTDPGAQLPPDLEFLTNTLWIKTATQAISGTNITFEFTIHLGNGTEQTNTWSIDVDAGRGFPFYFISANLSAGDTTYGGDVNYPPGPIINATLHVEYLGQHRETNHLNITRFFEDFHGWKNYHESYNYYWDRTTGILTQYSYQRSYLSGTENYSTSALTSFRIVDTNVRWVRIQGDINSDNKVDIQDLAQASIAFGSYLGHPKWNQMADINHDAKVDIKDLVVIAKNFGTRQ